MLTHQITTVATFNIKDFEGIEGLKVVSSVYWFPLAIEIVNWLIRSGEICTT